MLESVMIMLAVALALFLFGRAASAAASAFAGLASNLYVLAIIALIATFLFSSLG